MVTCKDVQRVDKFRFEISRVGYNHEQQQHNEYYRQATLQLADVWKMKDTSCDLKKQLVQSLHSTDHLDTEEKR